MKPCTCHPDDHPPKPCMGKYALHACLDESDRRFALAYCDNNELRYLSHESYVTGKTHEVRIAVEDYAGRSEIKLYRKR